MKTRSLCVMIVAVGLAVSCQSVANEAGESVAQRHKAHLAVSFRVNPEQRVGEADTYSVDNPGVETDEGTAAGYVPRDVWVIQYAGVDDDALLSGLPKYVEISGALDIQAVASTEENTLVFVANTHDATLEFGDIGTLGKMKQACRKIEAESDCVGSNFSSYNDLIFSGKCVAVMSNGNISAELVRSIARLDFTLRNAVGSAMKLHKIQLCRVPRNYCYASGIVDRGAIFPEVSDFFDYPKEGVVGAMNPGGEQSFTFYMPANQRGINSASTSSKTKPTYAPTYSSYLRIEATDPGNKAYVYTIYPGANMVNDYNILANHRYAIQLTVNSSGEAESDSRVEDYGPVDLGSANSYILNPPPVGAEPRVFTIPVGRLNEFWKEKDPSLMISPGDGWTVDLIWQDTPIADLIRFVDPITGALSTTTHGTGPDERIVVITKDLYEGNAVIGLKKDGRESVGYLWSWHLWVTSYDPQYKLAWQGGRYVYSVPGGAVHRYNGYAWDGYYNGKYIMDRNLGARTDGFSMEGALYYQFGRKDPFPCVGYGNVVCDINGVPLTPWDPKNPNTMYQDANAGVTIATGVLNPTRFYYKRAELGYGNWTMEGKLGPYAWNNPVEGVEKKSIFDPCPQGWAVPLVDIWSDFNFSPGAPWVSTCLDGVRSEALSWIYKGTNGVRYWPSNQAVTGSVYYPAVGTIHVALGTMRGEMEESYYWASQPGDKDLGHCMTARADYMNARNWNHLGFGFPVRCVQQ